MNSHNGRKKYISKDFLVFDDIMLFKGMLKAALDGAKKLKDEIRKQHK